MGGREGRLPILPGPKGYDMQRSHSALAYFEGTLYEHIEKVWIAGRQFEKCGCKE